MREKIYTWHKIVNSIEEIHFSANGMTEMEVAGKTLCIAMQNDNQIAACSQKCPHAGGKLSNGNLDAVGNIVCPLHRYKFSLQTGRNISGEGYFLKTYPIEIREDGVFAGFEQNNLFNW